MKTIHLIISGKVQGVFFRASAKKKAKDLNLTGWVKNTLAGNVEIIASGESEVLEKYIKWCHNGPDNARVENVKINNREYYSFDTFEIIRN
ncbi:MAG: acylphosphatase [Ginsengibacter sp.]